MNYLQKNNSRKNIVRQMMWGAFLFFLLVAIRALFFSGSTYVVYAIAKPVWHMRDVFFGTGAKITSSTESKESLMGRIQALESEVYALQIKNMELETSVQRSTLQSSSIDLQKSKGRIIAKITSKPPFTPFDTFLLDVGTGGGVMVGARVFVESNIFVGTITKAGKDFSEVTLFSSGSNSYEARVLRTGETLLVHGDGGGSFSVVLPKDFDIQEGDVLVDGTRDGHIITEIYSIDESSPGSFKKAYARIPVNIFRAEWVGVEKLLAEN